MTTIMLQPAQSKFDNLKLALRTRSRGDAELDYLNQSTSPVDLEMRQREIDRFGHDEPCPGSARDHHSIQRAAAEPGPTAASCSPKSHTLAGHEHLLQRSTDWCRDWKESQRSEGCCSDVEDQLRPTASEAPMGEAPG